MNVIFKVSYANEVLLKPLFYCACPKIASNAYSHLLFKPLGSTTRDPSGALKGSPPPPGLDILATGSQGGGAAASASWLAGSVKLLLLLTAGPLSAGSAVQYEEEQINASYTDGQQLHDRTKLTAQHGDLQGASHLGSYSWHFT
jgi:hypothetical protein